MSNWVDDTCFRWLINRCWYTEGKQWPGELVAGYLNLGPDLDCLFEASKCTQCGDGLAGDSLKFGEFSATTASIFQNAFCIFSQLWNIHQRTRQNLNTRSSPCRSKSFGHFDTKENEVSTAMSMSHELKELQIQKDEITFRYHH